MLTTERLLQKRFKFISPYPGGHWEIGEVFELCGNKCYATESMSHIIMHESILMAYAHIFQPLPWWSDREIGDLPAFIKTPAGDIKTLEVYDNGIMLDGCKLSWGSLSQCTPATIEQYNQQKEGKK